MKFLFRKKKQDTGEQPSIVAKGLQSGYKYLRNGWAAWMTKRTAGFSRRTWKTLLALFIIFYGSYSIYLAASAFSSKEKKSFSITSIKKPKHATETDEDNTALPQVAEAEYRRIKRFRAYMDSLARSPSGKIIYDSITKSRRGLMDSIKLVENYYEQLKQE